MMVPDYPDPDTGGHPDDRANWIIFAETSLGYLLSPLTFISITIINGLKYQLPGLGRAWAELIRVVT